MTLASSRESAPRVSELKVASAARLTVRRETLRPLTRQSDSQRGERLAAERTSWSDREHQEKNEQDKRLRFRKEHSVKQRSSKIVLWRLQATKSVGVDNRMAQLKAQMSNWASWRSDQEGGRRVCCDEPAGPPNPVTPTMRILVSACEQCCVLMCIERTLKSWTDVGTYAQAVDRYSCERRCSTLAIWLQTFMRLCRPQPLSREGVSVYSVV